MTEGKITLSREQVCEMFINNIGYKQEEGYYIKDNGDTLERQIFVTDKGAVINDYEGDELYSQTIISSDEIMMMLMKTREGKE